MPQDTTLSYEDALKLANAASLGLANAQVIKDQSDAVAELIDAGGAISLDEANTWTAAQNVALVTLTDAATINTNAALGNLFTVTLGGNRTLANPTNLVAGGTYCWIIKQDGTGGRTLAFGASFLWPAGDTPVVSASADSVDIITAVYDGTNLLASIQQDFA